MKNAQRKENQKNSRVGFFIDDRKFFIAETIDNKDIGYTPVFFKKGIIPDSFFMDNKIDPIGSVKFFKKIREDISSEEIIFQDIENKVNQKAIIKASKIAGFTKTQVKDWKDNIEALLVGGYENQEDSGIIFFHNENFKEKINLYIIKDFKIKNTINYTGDIEDNVLDIAKRLKNEKIRKVYFSGDFGNTERLKELFFALKLKADTENIWQNFFSTNDFIPDIFFEESHKFIKPYVLSLPEKALEPIFQYIYDSHGLKERQNIINNYKETFSEEKKNLKRKVEDDKSKKTLKDKISIKDDIFLAEKKSLKKINSMQTTETKVSEKRNLISKIKKVETIKNKRKSLPKAEEVIVPSSFTVKTLNNANYKSPSDSKSEKSSFSFFDKNEKVHIDSVSSDNKILSKNISKKKKIKSIPAIPKVVVEKNKKILEKKSVLETKKANNSDLKKEKVISKNISKKIFLNSNSSAVAIKTKKDISFEKSLKKENLNIKLKEKNNKIENRIIELKNKTENIKKLSLDLEKKVTMTASEEKDKKIEKKVLRPKEVIKDDILSDLENLIPEIKDKENKKKMKETFKKALDDVKDFEKKEAKKISHKENIYYKKELLKKFNIRKSKLKRLKKKAYIKVPEIQIPKTMIKKSKELKEILAKKEVKKESIDSLKKKASEKIKIITNLKKKINKKNDPVKLKFKKTDEQIKNKREIFNWKLDTDTHPLTKNISNQKINSKKGWVKKDTPITEIEKNKLKIKEESQKTSSKLKKFFSFTKKVNNSKKIKNKKRSQKK